MSDEDTTTETATVTAETPEAPKPTETVEFWKQKAREQEKKAKENVAARLELDELKASQLSKEEKLAADLSEVAKRAERAEAEAMRWRVAAKYGISDADAELFLTASDEESLVRQAERFKELAPRPAAGTYVPNAGKRPEQPASLGDQIAAAESSGDSQLAMSLKVQQIADLARAQNK